MYSNTINSKNPTLIVFLVDRSLSMVDPWASSSTGISLCQGAATAINEVLYDLSLRACMKDDSIIDRVHLGIYAYGDESVEWALPGLPEGKGWSEAPGWVPGYSRIEEVEVGEDGGRVRHSEIPIWIEAEANGNTPMCAAFYKAAEVVERHVTEYPDSFPPIVINITDGLPTDTSAPLPMSQDEEYLPVWDDVRSAANRITTKGTGDGEALLLNIHITPSKDDGSLLFPDMIPAGAHDYIHGMMSISSVLPANMVLEGRDNGHDLKEGAKGLIVNGDRTMLSQFLRIGTTVKVEDKEQRLLTRGDA